MTEMKERVRVQAGRGGAPKQANLPAKVTNSAPAAQAPAADNMLSVIAAAVIDPRCDVAKMQALLDMQKQIEEREAEKAFTRAFLPLQKELPVINRDGKIEVRAKDQKGERTGPLQQSTPYATYPNIMTICKPILHDHGFTFSSKVKPAGDGRILVISRLKHVDGHFEESEFPLQADTTGSKNNAQGWGSSQQYGMRYNALALLNIITRAAQEHDSDGHDGAFKHGKVKQGEALIETQAEELVSEDQLIKVRELIEWCGVPIPKFCEHFGIKKISDLPAKMFEAAKKDCIDYKANRDRKAEQAQQQPIKGNFR